MPPKSKAASKAGKVRSKKQTYESDQAQNGQLLQQSNNVEQKLKENNEPSIYLEDIKRFDKSRLKKSFGGSVAGSAIGTGSQLSSKEVTYGQNGLCLDFWNGQAYPVHEIKSMVSQFSVNTTITLNFAGVSALTDIVFRIMAKLREKESRQLDAVTGVILDGCYLVTDTGLAWLSQAFPLLSKISLLGCYNITEAGAITLSQGCPSLASINLSGTGVRFLPKRWLNQSGLEIRTSACPLVVPRLPIGSSHVMQGNSPPAEENQSHMVKVLVLLRDNSPVSLVSILQGQEQPPQIFRPRVLWDVQLTDSLRANVLEAGQALAHLLTSNSSVVVIPSHATDAADLPAEASSIGCLILEILAKYPKTHFVLVDCNTGSSASHYLKLSVTQALSQAAEAIRSNFSVETVNKMSTTRQLEEARAWRLHQSIIECQEHIQAVAVDVNKLDKESLLQMLATAAKSLEVVKDISYSSQIFSWAKDFHKSGPVQLHSQIHSLNEAAEIIAGSSLWMDKLACVGAAQFLSDLGLLTSWTNRAGQSVVAHTSWLFKHLAVLLSPLSAGVANMGQDHTVADQTVLWALEDLRLEAENSSLNWLQTEQILKEFPCLWLTTSKSLTSTCHLPEEPSMSMKVPLEFDRNQVEDLLLVKYSFTTVHLLSQAILDEVMTLLLQLHKAIHVWRKGLIIYDSIVAVVFSQSENRKVLNLCAYMTSGPKDGFSVSESNAKLIYSTVDKYRSVIRYVLTRHGLVWEQSSSVSNSIRQNPGNLFHSHKLSVSDPGLCTQCGTTWQQNLLTTSIDLALYPAFLKPEHVKFQELKGQMVASMLELTGPCHLSFSAQLDPLGCGQCSILLMEGDVHLLQISFSSPDKSSVVIDLAEGSITRTVLEETQTYDVSSQLSQVSLVGQLVTAKIVEQNPFRVGIFLGPCLLQSVPLQYNSYGLIVSSHKFESEGNSAQFTIHSTHFRARAAEIHEGMRLEAVDRLNPHLVCVATIAKVNPEAGKVLIHFDGWTPRYDYWAEFSHHHLHPIGYMHYKGVELSKQYNMNQNLQVPYGYNKEFDWLTYLQEVGAEPVPFSFFNEKQSEKIPDNIINELQSSLGSVFPNSAESVACQNNPWRASFLEQQANLYVDKFQDGNQEIEAAMNSKNHFFCLLPQSLSVKSLRFPALDSIFSEKLQQLHFLCPGQVVDLHHVNHPGFPLNLKSLKSWLKVLLNTYACLLVQRQTLPLSKSALCAGDIPETTWPYLEAAMKRLYKLYLMHCFYFWSGPSTQEGSTEESDVVEAILDSALKSDDQTLAQQLSYSPANSQLLCSAHKLANSPGQGLQELHMDKFLSLASSVYVLQLEKNPLSCLPADLFSHFVNLTHLWLDNCKLSELPSFQKNAVLEEIHVRQNSLTCLPGDMSHLTSLRILDISNNPLEVLPNVISTLKSLTELYADNIGNVDLADVCPLINLTKLSISQNYIDKIPEEISALPLVVLEMGGLPMMSTKTSWSVQAVNKHLDMFTVYSRIPAKERQEMVENIESTAAHSTSSAKIAELNQILLERYPRLGHMRATDGDSIPEPLMKIKTLEKLDIPFHAFKSVPDSVSNLTKLEHLNLADNPCLKTISAQLALLPIKELHLKDCPSLKTPPREVVRRGFLAVMGYLKRLLEGSVACRRTKLMMVGLGGAGKTSLVNSLTSPTHQFYQDYREVITDGINITEWVVPLDSPEYSGDGDEATGQLHFSVWDFAGQTVYYNTHQFFLSNRAVYLLLWNIRLGFEHAGLDFWLSSIACHAPKAPVFVIGSHCDKVQKGKLPKEELRRRFPQIAGFYFISSYTGEGIPELKADLIEAALSQKYMGEMIPEAWLNLEIKLDSIRRSEEKALMSWGEIEECASAAGIFDHTELVQAVQFLHDLGSVQFFNTSFLRSHVVIIPQWIIDVMACIVTVHEGPIKDGKFVYSDMSVVWQKFPADLHTWLLRLTEEFDLTFPLSSEPANLVPCLLPNSEPKFDFAPVNKEMNERESRLLYRFEYLPAGLFNRAQVRLHEFSDSSVIWKRGVLLRKNEHRALLAQISNTEVAVTARGYQPENTLFLVHEVFECLIADSYTGVSYDFSVPCIECLVEPALDPCMFSASKIKRAADLKVPFLQCDRYFHIISLPDIYAVMPPDNGSDLDDHLSRSVRELQELEASSPVRLMFVYSHSNLPSLAQADSLVSPTRVLADLKSAGFIVSYCDNPETVNMSSMTSSIKSAQVIIFCVSEVFLANPECCNLIIYTKQVLHANLVVLALGRSLDWQKKNSDINLILADEVFVNMTQYSRYETKLLELIETIKSRCQRKQKVYPECFISYCWANSQTAVDLGSASVPGAIGWGDPRTIKSFLQSKGINCWIDVEQMGQEGFFKDIAEGVRKAKVMVACVSDEYANSKTCKMEFRFAVSTLKLPTILAVVGTGYTWERTEIGLLAVGHSLSCPKVNLQYQNEAGLLDLLKEVQTFLDSSCSDSDRKSSLSQHLTSIRSIAFQEALELAQRKFLRHIVQNAGSIEMESYPRLIVLDLQPTEDQPKDQSEESPGITPDTHHKFQFQVLCECEQGWHQAPTSIQFPPLGPRETEEFLQNIAPYLVRMWALLRHSQLSLAILTSPKGEQLYRKIQEWCPRTWTDFSGQYKQLVQAVLEQDENRSYGGLKRCQMSNGKVLWLCPSHEESRLQRNDNKQANEAGHGKEQARLMMEKQGGPPNDSSFMAADVSILSPEEEPDNGALNSDQEEGEKQQSTDEGEGQQSTDGSEGQKSTDEGEGQKSTDRGEGQQSTDGGEGQTSTDGAELRAIQQLPVRVLPTSGQTLPRRPKLARRTSSRKTTSQACLLM